MKRQKAWVGALIGAASSIIGSGIQARAVNKAKNEALLKENTQIGRNMAANLDIINNNHENDEYYNNIITMKTGGRFRGTQVSHAKRYSCGGRKKALAGIIKPLDASKLGAPLSQIKPNLDTKLNITPQQPQVNTGMSALGQEALGAGIGALGNLASAYIMSKAYKAGGKYKAKRR